MTLVPTSLDEIDYSDLDMFELGDPHAAWKLQRSRRWCGGTTGPAASSSGASPATTIATRCAPTRSCSAVTDVALAGLRALLNSRPCRSAPRREAGAAIR
jgi:hypothetical protein